MNFSWMMKIFILLVSSTSMVAFAGNTLHFKTGAVSTGIQSMSVGQQAHTFQQHSTDYFVVQYDRHVSQKDKTQLAQAGLSVLGYFPDDGFIVKAHQGANIGSLKAIKMVVPYLPQFKVSPRFGVLDSLSSQREERALVQLFEGERLSEVRDQLVALGVGDLQFAEGKSIGLVTTRGGIDQIAALEGVAWVQEYPEFEFSEFKPFSDAEPSPNMVLDIADLDGYESGTKVMNFDQAWARGYTGVNQLVAFSDSGLDSGKISTLHPDFQGQVLKGYSYGFLGFSWKDPMGHGTHVAGSIAGNGSASNGVVKGGAYGAQLIAGGMWSSLFRRMLPPTDIAKMFKNAYDDGARLHTNSWGSPMNLGAYDQFAATVDEFSWDNPEMLILFAAGNSGKDANQDGRVDYDSIGSPATAKNVLSVGASENQVFNGGIQRFVGEMKDKDDAQLYPSAPLRDDKISDNPDGIAIFSSRGPTDDGRIKPDVVAPGSNILSVRSQVTGASELWGAVNPDYVWSGGTSMATPLVAGAAAVLRQYLDEEKRIDRPSAALVKAMLMHTAHDMYPGQFGEVGEVDGQEMLFSRPNNHQGFGRVDMDRATSFNSGMIVDEPTGVFANDFVDHSMSVMNPTTLEATLVYTDAPAAASSSRTLVNNLNLEILVDGQVVASGTDAVNNFEHVAVRNVSGDVTVRVVGENIPTARPNGALPYALVVSTGYDIVAASPGTSGGRAPGSSDGNGDSGGNPWTDIIDKILGR